MLLLAVREGATGRLMSRLTDLPERMTGSSSDDGAAVEVMDS